MFFILALFCLASVSAEGAEMVVHNARIYTLDPRQPVASAMAIDHGRIVYVGNDASRYAGTGTRSIDAHGATVLPGLIDSHAHMEALGDQMETFDLREVRTREAVAAIVAEAAHKLEPGQWVRGQGWDQTNWGGQFPTARDLDSAGTRNPVFLSRVDGHAAWVNRKALELAGIDRHTPDPPNGRILRDARGEPTGVLIDAAQELIVAKIPPATLDQTKRRILRAARECARLGLTTIHDAGVGRQGLEAYHELIAHGELPVRIYAMIGGPGPLWEEYLKRGPEIGDRLTVRSIKLYADGALGSRGAALFEPYSDDPGNRGLLMLTREQIEVIGRQAVAHGFQVNTHAIGDRANHTVIEAYGAALGGANDRRFRIEHAQVIAPGDFGLFRRYSILASMQPTHATSDMRWAETRLGPERVKGAYAWRSFRSLGVPVPSGSDFPVESPDPLPGFYAAVTRQDANGNPPGGWFPDQRMTREEALKSWTLAGAYAAFEEDSKGSLVPGKVADFVMLSADIMRVPAAEILKARVTMTVVGGQVVWNQGPEQTSDGRGR